MRMNKSTAYTHRYLSIIKVLLPIIRKQERTYLKHMKTNIDDYCEDNNISCIEELYQQFGEPQEVVSDYLSSMKTETILKFTRIHRTAKYALLIFSICILSGSLYLCSTLYIKHKSFMNQEPTYFETVITIPKEDLQ